MSRITRIRIPATFFLDGKRRDEVADFTLGAGPCGKEATTLAINLQDNFVIVTQETRCGESKEFLYRTADLIGRIEVTTTDSLGDDIPGDPCASYPLDDNAGVPSSATAGSLY